MKRINKKGFTLIEMLGAVAILGIIATIGIVSVSKVIKSAHNKFDYTQYDSFMQAAETYFSDNKSRLPLTPMDWKEITLQELINKKYIEKMLDSNKQEFDYARSKVVVTRLTSGKYKYEAILYRKKGSPIGKISNKVTNQNSNITFRLRDKNKYHKENKTYYVRDYPVVDIGISDTDQLSGYQYIIYRNGKQFKKSENIEISGGLSVKEAVTLGKEFPFGKYSIKVVAYDKSGNKTTNSTDNSGLGDDAFSIYIDRIKPNCAIQIDGKIGDNGWYKEKDISLTLKESDKESGLLKHDMQTSKNFPNLGTLNTLTTLVKKQSDTGSTTWYAHVEDKAGNICETEVSVKVDTKKPRCEVVSNSSSEAINTSKWYNKYTAYKIEQLKLNQSDEGPSGINRHILEMNTSNLATTYKSHNDNDYVSTEEGEHNYNGYVRDYAGNDINCSTFIRKDTIDPECPSYYYVQYTPYNIPNVFISPDITFNWLGFSPDTIYADAFVQELGTPYKYNYGRYYGSATYRIAGRVDFTGTYESELVAYDQAENDKHCFTGATEVAEKPEPVTCKEVDGLYYDNDGNIVSEEEYNISCGIIVEEPEPDEVPDMPTFNCVNIRGHYYDKDGNSVTKEEYEKSCDVSPGLSCPKIESKSPTEKWLNSDVTIEISDVVSSAGSYDWWTYNSKDGWTEQEYGTPITKSKFTKKISADGKRRGRIVLHDKNDPSKTIKCETDAYWIDQNNPTCEVTSVTPKPKAACHNWYGVTGDNIKLKATCKDGKGSGCKETSDTQTIKVNEYKGKSKEVKVTFEFKDNSGKTGKCSETVKIDGKGPKIVGWSKERGSSQCGTPAQTFKYVIHPHIQDEDSGYAGGSWTWKSNHQQSVTRDNVRGEHRECIGSSSVTPANQTITWNIHDCVGNVTKDSRSGFANVHTE